MCCPWIRDPVQVVSTTSNHRHSLLVDDTKRGFPAMLGSLAPNVSGLPEVGALPQIGTTTPRPPQGGPNTGLTGPMLHIGPRTGPMSNPLRRWGWTSPSMSRVRWGQLLLLNSTADCTRWWPRWMQNSNSGLYLPLVNIVLTPRGKLIWIQIYNAVWYFFYKLIRLCSVEFW